MRFFKRKLHITGFIILTGNYKVFIKVKFLFVETSDDKKEGVQTKLYASKVLMLKREKKKENTSKF